MIKIMNHSSKEGFVFILLERAIVSPTSSFDWKNDLETRLRVYVNGTSLILAVGQWRLMKGMTREQFFLIKKISNKRGTGD